MMDGPPHDRSPFKRVEKLDTLKQHAQKSIIFPSERVTLQANVVTFFISALFMISPDLRVLVAETTLIIPSNLLWYISLIVCAICLSNTIFTIWVIFLRTSSTPPIAMTVPKEANKYPSDTPLSVPKSLARDRVVDSPGIHSRFSSPQVTPSKTGFALKSSSPLSDTIQTKSVSMDFSSIYGTPQTAKVSTPHTSKPSPLPFTSGTPKKGDDRRTMEFTQLKSTPLPDTGSPKVNKTVRSMLPEWTEELRKTLSSKTEAASKPSGRVIYNDRKEEDIQPVAPRERKIIEADMALKELGLTYSIEEITENLRKWFRSQILIPLKEDIQLVTNEFSKMGLDFLSPYYPATFSLFSRTNDTSMKSNTIMMAGGGGGGGGFAASSRPQTLLELYQRNPNDPLVQKRLKIERYLAFSSISSHRSAIIKRISELADDFLLGSLRWNRDITPISSSSLSAHDNLKLSSNDDSQILIYLFCAFMDEHLPSESFHESQPFSSRCFVSYDQKPNPRFDAIQIQQIYRDPPYFRLIAEDKIYEVAPGSHNVLIVIALFVEYVHRKYNGFLGVGNLGSTNIDLVSILNVL